MTVPIPIECMLSMVKYQNFGALRTHLDSYRHLMGKEKVFYQFRFCVSLLHHAKILIEPSESGRRALVLLKVDSTSRAAAPRKWRISMDSDASGLEFVDYDSSTDLQDGFDLSDFSTDSKSASNRPRMSTGTHQ